jgi:hypothetical protein
MEIVILLVELWVFLSIFCLLIVAGLCFAVRHSRIHRLGIFRASMWRVVSISLALAGLLVGLGGGYLDAWTDHRGWAGYYDNPDRLQRCCEILRLTAGFGPDIANIVRADGDWGNDDEWDCRGKVALWSGLLSFMVAVPASGLVYYILRKD